MNKYNKNWRVPTKVLSVLTIVMSLSVSSISYAANINDIREATGNIRSDTEEFREQSKDIIANYTEINDKNDYVDFINSFNLEEKYRKRIEDEEVIYESYKNTFEKSIKECESYEIIMGNLYKLRSQADIVKENENKLSGVVGKEYTENNYEEAYNKVRNLMESQEDTTNYGYIGDKLKPILSNKVTEVYIPYGRYIDNSGNTIDNYGLYLKTPEYANVEVNNIFNGTCTNKSQDENGQYIIEITNSNYLKTTYWYIDDCYINIGDTINQYDKVGMVYAGHKKVYFDVQLDGDYINPLMLMGKVGKKAYEEYILAYGETLVNIESLNADNQISDTEKAQSSKEINSKVDGVELTPGENSHNLDNEISDSSIDSSTDLVSEDVRDKEEKERANTKETEIVETEPNRVHKLE